MTPPATFRPPDAGRLLRDPSIIAFACDVTRNKAFWQADAKTRDAHGKRVCEYVRSPEERDAWPGRVEALFKLPPQELQAAMDGEPVRLGEVRKPDGRVRVVGVPTFLRRCASNVVKSVLEMTGDQLLPESVRAYRPGSREAVKTALLDVALRVRERKIIYWAKLDFSSYFSTMPWTGIEEALRHYEYGEDFISVLMALVRCPLLKKTKTWRGRLVPVPNIRGAQMGLAESSTLANLLPWELDERFDKLAGRVLYVRYSDDLLIGSAFRSEVVGAVCHVQAWARKLGIRLKGVSPDMRAERLVHDVRNRRIDLLGAEIDQNGEVRLPVKKLKEKLAEIERRCENLAEDDEVVKGISRYGNGDGAYRFDLDDVIETVDGFLSYWNDLDPRGARQAESLIRKNFPVPAQACTGGRGTVWCARLWDHQAGGGAEAMHPAAHDPRDLTEANPRALRASGEASSNNPESRTKGMESHDREDPSEPDPTSIGNEDDPDTELGVFYTNEEAAIPVEGDFDGNGEADSSSSTSEEGGENDSWTESTDDNPSRAAEGRKTYRFSSWSTDELEQYLAGLYDGTTDDPPQEEPPLPADFANVALTYLHTKRVPGAKPARWVLGACVAVDRQVLGTPSTAVVTHRPEAATVRRMLSMLTGTSEAVTFALERTWLAKTLLQKHRRLRAPLLFASVAELHAAAIKHRAPVRVACGLSVPPELAGAIRRTVHAELLRAHRPLQQTSREAAAPNEGEPPV